MSNEDYRSLSSVKQEVAEKRDMNKRLKERIRAMIQDVHSTKDIQALLDYSPREIGTIHQSEKIDLDTNGNKDNELKNMIRVDKGGLASKFRQAGVSKYRTRAAAATINSIDESKQEILNEIYGSWKIDMLNWITEVNDGLSNDEEKVADIKYDFVKDDAEHSEFSKEVLRNLNEGDIYKTIKYENGKVDSATNNIIVIDLSEK